MKRTLQAALRRHTLHSGEEEDEEEEEATTNGLAAAEEICPDAAEVAV